MYLIDLPTVHKFDTGTLRREDYFVMMVVQVSEVTATSPSLFTRIMSVMRSASLGGKLEMLLLTDDFEDGKAAAGGSGRGDPHRTNNHDMEAAYRALAHLGAAAGIVKHLGIASRAGPEGE